MVRKVVIPRDNIRGMEYEKPVIHAGLKEELERM